MTAWLEFDGSGPDVDADGNEARTEDDPDLNFSLRWSARGFVPVPQTSSNWRGK